LEQPFGWAQMLFGITGTTLQTQRHVEVTGGGNTTVTAQLRPISSLTGENAGSLDLTINRTGTIGPNTELATITLSGISVVNALGNTPAGIYGLHVTGSLVTNIETHVINELTPATPTQAATQILPGRQHFRPWGQDSLLVPGVINVGGVTEGGAIATTGVPIAISWTPGPAFTVDGVTTQFGGGLQSINISAPAVIHGVTVPHSTLFVPFRSVVAAMTNTAGETLPGESVIEFFEGSGDNPHSIVLSFGDNVAQFTIGHSTFVLNGLVLPMTNPSTGAPVYAFIGDGTNGTVANTFYLPLRFIAAALGFDITDGVGQSLVTPR